MKTTIYFTGYFLVTFLLSININAKTMQEGWYKVYIGNSHMGYFVQRYEIDEKTKNFISTYFFKTNALGGNITESLKAVADSKLQPISYQFTNQTGENTKTIDMSFKNKIMSGTITNDGKKEKINIKIGDDVFLSTFLTYWLALPQRGIKKGMDQSYSAIAEEDGKVEKGSVKVKEEEILLGQKVLKLVNSFKDTSWVSLVTPNDGISLSTKSPVQGIRTEISSRAEATATFMVNEKLLASIFGSVPNDAYYKKIAANSEPAGKIEQDIKKLSPDIEIEKADKPKGLPVQKAKPQMIPDPARTN